MADQLKTVQSIAWMVNQLKAKGQFNYFDWAAKFRESAEVKTPRTDRKFQQHKKVLIREFLMEGEERELKPSGEGNYSLSGNSETFFARLARVGDPKARTALPLLSAVHQNPSLVPIPSREFLKALVEVLDVEDKDLDHIVYKSSSPWQQKPEFVSTVLDAIHAQKQLRVEPLYDRKSCDVTPILLLNYDGAWYLLAKRGNLLQYNLARVKKLSLTDIPSEPLSKQHLEQFKQSILRSYGSFLVSGKPELSEGQPVKVRFTQDAQKIARERFPIHPVLGHKLHYLAQETEAGYEVLFHVQNYIELISELLRWGPDAEALEPPEFREAWLSRLRETAQKWLLVGLG